MKDQCVNNLLSPSQLAQDLGISIETVYAWTSQKRIPYFKVSRLVRFNLSDVNEWLAGQKIAPHEYDH